MSPLMDELLFPASTVSVTYHQRHPLKFCQFFCLSVFSCTYKTWFNMTHDRNNAIYISIRKRYGEQDPVDSLIVRKIKRKTKRAVQRKIQYLFHLESCDSNSSPMLNFAPSLWLLTCDLFPVLPFSLQLLVTARQNMKSQIRNSTVSTPL